MNEITVSVTCTKCGCPVIFHLRLETAGGISGPCCNCGGLVTATYSCGYNGRVRIQNVRTLGGSNR